MNLGVRMVIMNSVARLFDKGIVSTPMPAQGPEVWTNPSAAMPSQKMKAVRKNPPACE